MSFVPMTAGGSRMTETVLWENSTPSASFSANTAALSFYINTFDYIKVVYRRVYNDSTDIGTVIYPVSFFVTTALGNAKNNCLIGTRGTSYIYYRVFYRYSDDSIRFGDAYNTNGATVNGYLIPVQIIGIKT